MNVTLKNTAGVVSIQNSLGSDVKITNSMNNGNLLAGITPTFTNWATQPGTAADFVEETFDKEITTYGASNAGATIRWDMGAPYRVLAVSDNQYSDMITWASLDAVTWRQVTLNNVAAIAGIYRYFEMRCGVHAQIKWIKLIAYRV